MRSSISSEIHRAQKGFSMLSSSDQTALKMTHEFEAHTINDAMNLKIQAVLNTPENVLPCIIDHGEYFEVRGERGEVWYVSIENLGEPQCSEIQINPKYTYFDMPQAWSEMQDGKTSWLYNYQGALKEALYSGEYIPSWSEFIKMFNSISGKYEEKQMALNISLETSLYDWGFWGEERSGVRTFLKKGR